MPLVALRINGADSAELSVLRDISMKRNSALMILGLLGIVWTGSGLATAFASGDRIEIRSEDSGVFAPGTSRYEFTLFDTQTQKALGDADLRITHEKRLHMFVYDRALREFPHVHPMTSPEPNEGILHTTFPAAGDYRLWIQFKDGGELKVVPLSVTVHAR